jgi:thiol-disulfide isomerase/thioredoxin
VQSFADPPPLEFPSLWIGSNPIEVADLKGKAALLYFFEESCPKCKGFWPALMAMAQKYADKPIAFVAVNSGTPAPLVAEYARSVRLSWPVIVDLDRSFERACTVGEISLQNVRQISYITAEGEYQRGNFNKLEDTIERALKGARWEIDPAEIPPELWPVWRSIEFAQYAPAAQPLAKARNARSAEVKAAAEKLAKLVDAKAAEALAAAKEEKSKIRAHELYAAVARRFEGYPPGDEAAAAQREIARDPGYRQELAAIKQLERQRRMANSAKPAVRERARAAIQKIIDENPDGEAARLGREMLEENGA